MLQAVFDESAALTSLQRTGCYRCAANLFWVDMTSNATPGVPLCVGRVKDWAATVFANGPHHLKEIVLIRVKAADEDLKGARGAWKQISPEELTHSIVFHLADRIQRGADEGELQAWKNIVQSAPLMFQVLDTEDSAYWESHNLRQRIEVSFFFSLYFNNNNMISTHYFKLMVIYFKFCACRIVATHDTIRRSARQLCFEVHLYKERQEANLGESLTIKRLQQMYKDKAGATMAKSAKQEVGESYVGDCLKIYDKLLCDDLVNQQLDVLESKWQLQSCLNSILKLKTIVGKTDSLQERQWVISWLVDAVSANALSNDAVSGRH